jgi:hypothetical protein
MYRADPTSEPFSLERTWNKPWRLPTAIKPWRLVRWVSRFVNCATGFSNWKWIRGDFANDIVAQCAEIFDKCYVLFAGRHRNYGPASANEWPEICFRVKWKRREAAAIRLAPLVRQPTTIPVNRRN